MHFQQSGANESQNLRGTSTLMAQLPEPQKLADRPCNRYRGSAYMHKECQTVCSEVGQPVVSLFPNSSNIRAAQPALNVHSCSPFVYDS